MKRKIIIPVMAFLIYTIVSCDVEEIISYTYQNEAILAASDYQYKDYFGASVDINGNYAIVGSPYADVDGNNMGQAFIYKNDGSDNWNEIAILKASDRTDKSLFGSSVAIQGDYAVVGAPYTDSGFKHAGQTYIFKNDGTDNWNEIAILEASDESDYDFFGSSVVIDRDYIVVAACDSINVSDDPAVFDMSVTKDSVYIFKNNGADNWNEVAILSSCGSTFFGSSIDIDGDYVIIGSKEKYSNELVAAGKTYIYINDGSDNWNEAALLRASDAESLAHFGSSVSINGNYAIISSNNELSDSQIYIFRNYGNNTWLEGEIFPFSNTYMINVAIDGAYIIVGSPEYSYYDKGKAVMYKKNESRSWNEVRVLEASDGQVGDSFGYSVSIDGGYSIVGAPEEKLDDDDRGHAYIFY